jgi:hypothetical protein
MAHLFNFAMALANNVLPVPGGPTNKLLFGILPNKCISSGSLRMKQFLQTRLSFINSASSKQIPVSGF